MEHALDEEFASVRIHRRARLAHLHADAVTAGDHILFAGDRFDPATRSGQALIGHELMHVVQQRRRRAEPSSSTSSWRLDSDLEREAERAGELATSGASAFASLPAAGSSAPTEHAVQPRITLDDDRHGRLRRENLDELNRLLAGSGAQVAHDRHGEVHFQREADHARRDHAGYQLLRRVVGHHHNVRIGLDPYDDAAGTSYTNEPDTRDPRRGASAFINVPRRSNALASTIDRHGDLHVERVHRHLVLGHELVHADHAQRGRRQAPGTSRYRVEGYVGGYGRVSYDARASDEELNTTGLVPRAHRDDITENDLRRELGYLPRATYGGTVEENELDYHHDRIDELNDQIRWRRRDRDRHDEDARRHHGVAAQHERDRDAHAREGARLRQSEREHIERRDAAWRSHVDAFGEGGTSPFRRLAEWHHQQAQGEGAAAAHHENQAWQHHGAMQLSLQQRDWHADQAARLHQAILDLERRRDRHHDDVRILRRRL